MFTNNETAETEIREKIPFAIATRNIKYLEMNLTKEVKDLYSENYTTLKKEIKEDTNKWKQYCVRGLEELISSNVHTTKTITYLTQSLLKYQGHISQI